MKILCEIDLGNDNFSEKNKLFRPFKVVVMLNDNRNDEVTVDYEYNRNTAEIKHKRVRFRPVDLSISCSNVHGAEALLSIQVCQFVSEAYPHLSKIGCNTSKK